MKKGNRQAETASQASVKNHYNKNNQQKGRPCWWGCRDRTRGRENQRGTNTSSPRHQVVPSTRSSGDLLVCCCHGSGPGPHSLPFGVCSLPEGVRLAKGKTKVWVPPCLFPSAKLLWRNPWRCTFGRCRAAGGCVWVSLAALQRRWIPLGRESTEIPPC